MPCAHRLSCVVASQIQSVVYTGVSVSGLQRSSLQINPDCEEARTLREWWDTTGCCAPTQHAGEHLASARK